MGFAMTEPRRQLRSQADRPLQERRDPPAKNRVVGSRHLAANRVRQNHPQTPVTTSETSATFTITVSGIPCWPSRDPIGERGGVNIYVYVANNPLNSFDHFGLADSTTAWELGIEWLTGNGPRHHDFTDGDPFAEELRNHSNIQDGLDEAETKVGQRCGNNNESDFDFPYNYSLSGWGGIPKFIRDYSTIATGGASGNLSAAYLGSYGATFYVTEVDCCEKTAHVLIVVDNASTAASGTRPPWIGYTQWWQTNIAPLINAAFNSGPGSRTTQHIELNEDITF